jgi:hypothetical protein
MMAAQPDRTGLAVASMALAIASLPAAIVVGLGIPFGIAAIVCGLLGRHSAKRHLARFGILVGSIGIAVSIIGIVLWFVLLQSSP